MAEIIRSFSIAPWWTGPTGIAVLKWIGLVACAYQKDIWKKAWNFAAEIHCSCIRSPGYAEIIPCFVV
jgi:hypothetical protein